MSAEFPDNPCLVATFGDWHSDAVYAEQMVRLAAQHHADFLLHVGDFGIGFSRDFIDRLHAVLEETGLSLGFVDGNHEDFVNLYSIPVDDDGIRRVTDRIFHLPRGFRWQWWESTWMAMGGAHSINSHLLTPGYDWWTEETITWAQAENAIAGGRADVMVTHDVPDNVLGENGGGTWPEYQVNASNEHHIVLGQIVDEVRPSWLFHGHMHHFHETVRPLPEGGETKIIGLDCNGKSWRKNMVLFDPLLMETRPLKEAVV